MARSTNNREHVAPTTVIIASIKQGSRKLRVPSGSRMQKQHVAGTARLAVTLACFKLSLFNRNCFRQFGLSSRHCFRRLSFSNRHFFRQLC